MTHQVILIRSSATVMSSPAWERVSQTQQYIYRLDIYRKAFGGQYLTLGLVVCRGILFRYVLAGLAVPSSHAPMFYFDSKRAAEVQAWMIEAFIGEAEGNAPLFSWAVGAGEHYGDPAQLQCVTAEEHKRLERIAAAASPFDRFIDTLEGLDND